MSGDSQVSVKHTISGEKFVIMSRSSSILGFRDWIFVSKSFGKERLGKNLNEKTEFLGRLTF